MSSKEKSGPFRIRRDEAASDRRISPISLVSSRHNRSFGSVSRQTSSPGSSRSNLSKLTRLHYLLSRGAPPPLADASHATRFALACWHGRRRFLFPFDQYIKRIRPAVDEVDPRQAIRRL